MTEENETGAERDDRKWWEFVEPEVTALARRFATEKMAGSDVDRMCITPSVWPTYRGPERDFIVVPDTALVPVWVHWVHIARAAIQAIAEQDKQYAAVDEIGGGEPGALAVESTWRKEVGLDG